MVVVQDTGLLRLEVHKFHIIHDLASTEVRFKQPSLLKLLKIRTPTRKARLEYLIWRNGFIVESSFLIDYDPLPPISFTATTIPIGPITFL